MVGDHTGILGAVVFALYSDYFRSPSISRPALKPAPDADNNKCVSQHYKLDLYLSKLNSISETTQLAGL